MKTFNRIPVLLLLLVLAVLLSACSSGNADLQGPEREAVLAYTEPIADNLLAGLRDNNYEQFTRDFNTKMREAITAPEFEKLQQQLNPRIGSYQSREVQNVVDYGKIITITYRGKFEKADAVQILLTVEKEDPHQVTGLYFK